MFPGDEFFLTAFHRLSTCRPQGMGLGSIPWDKMRDYADYARYPHPEDFYYLMEAMDSEFLKYHAEKQKADG